MPAALLQSRLQLLHLFIQGPRLCSGNAFSICETKILTIHPERNVALAISYVLRGERIMLAVLEWEYLSLHMGWVARKEGSGKQN